MCADLPGGWQNPHPCQICGMVRCPLLCVCTIRSTSSRAVCDGHWAFLWGADRELIPDKIQELLEVGLPPLPCLLHSCFPICPTLGECMHHGIAVIYLNSSVHLTAFLSTYFGVWHCHCVFNAGLDLFALGNFLSCNGTPCWKCTLADATCTKQHQLPLCFISRGTVSVCPT